jgi:squalene monooxygenase
MDLYNIGWILSSVLSLFALYNLIFSGKRNYHDVNDKVKDSVTSTDAGDIQSEKLNGDADVIIVGAGIAGAALAHTLGKVLLY